jgi:TetR/AcrR family transcriptional regulator, cholesterol catabolism regulator
VAEGTLSPGKRAVRVGADLFAQRSYAATTTRELAKALGVTNGTFYHYYPNKEDLLLAICLEAMEGVVAAVEAVIAETDEGERQVRSLIEGHVAATLRDQSLHQTTLIELRSLSRANAQRVVERREHHADLVNGVLAGAQRTGFLREDVEGRVLGVLLLNLLNWTVFWLGDGPRSEREIGEMISTAFLEGSRGDSKSDRAPG